MLPAGHIAPLFWQHGEPAETLREEMRAMRSVGIRQCILESRPHPDWLGPGWWESLDTIFDEADALSMRIWVFDDATYPSGRAGDLMRDRHPDLLKVYLARREIEARGPTPHASFRIGAWVAEGERLVAVVAGKRSDPRGTGIVPGSIADLTERVRGGILRWDVPDGAWKLFVLVRTRDGGEEWTRDYLNPLVPEAGAAFIQEVHEAHFARYGSRFGSTFAGFFTDEPRFGNKPVYDALLGSTDMVVPWSDDLLAELSSSWGSSFRGALPMLWVDAGERSHRARHLYMDAVSRRFGRCFSEAIGDWCRSHGVEFIGHVVEDNEAHARLGHGAGHFFRAIGGQDMAGLDIVYSVWPGFPEGIIGTPFGPWDLDFFRWGIGKMASSAGHADPRKKGRTMCECFGAYGWQLGLRDMKWLTDAACVRGVNFLVPHAFSPKFPDPDCPPHFYARGNNPQWRLFGHWSAYAERVCHLLSDGEHRAPVAVLYHAEAEWAGRCEHFRHPVQAMASHQIDCDVLCVDALTDSALTRVGAGAFTVNRESFRCLVVPRAERLPARLLSFLARLLSAGVHVVFTGDAPLAASDADVPAPQLAALRAHPMAAIVPTTDLASALRKRGLAEDLSVSPEQPHLRTYRYARPGMDLVFCVNEDLRTPVDTRLVVEDARDPLGYDALSDCVTALEWTREGGRAAIRLRLEPYAALFIVFADEPSTLPALQAFAPMGLDLAEAGSVEGPWLVSVSETVGDPSFAPITRTTRAAGIGDLSAVEGLADFAGTVAYETDVVLDAALASEDLWIDLGEVGESSQAWWDGNLLGTRICPAHRYAIIPSAGAGARAGAHRLRVEVTTTLARKLGDNSLDRAMPQGPIGLVGPVRLLRRRNPPGARGPS
jgi:hypothetical protein